MLQRYGQTSVTPEQVCRCSAYSSCVAVKLTLYSSLVSILSPFMITCVGRIFGMEGREVAENIGAQAFYECSARTSEGIEEIFEHAVRAALIRVKPPKRKNCVIM
jgi:DNA integrity scanning protein DisA with diadenylate cyclase activity